MNPHACPPRPSTHTRARLRARIPRTRSCTPHKYAHADTLYARAAAQALGARTLTRTRQEWLWCETWCDDESKPRAKTIDLCNNPETKTPKLVRAPA